MGNRAVITAYEGKNFQKSYELGLYLHWNGGESSVKAFLEYANLMGAPSPEMDTCYGLSALCRIVSNYLGGSCGIGQLRRLDCDNYDNGVYIIKNWSIVRREFDQHGADRTEYPLREMMYNIDAAQPIQEQVGREVIDKWLTEHDYLCPQTSEEKPNNVIQFISRAKGEVQP